MNKTTKYYIDKEGIFGRLAIITLLAAIAARVVGCLSIREVVFGDWYTLLSQFALPVAGCLLFAASIFFFGRIAFWISSFPFAIGILFFILRISSYDNIAQTEFPVFQQLLCILYYLFLTVLYSGTVFGGIRIQWFLVPAFAVPLAAAILLEDIPAITSGYASMSSVFMEASVLLMLIACIFTVFGLRKKKIVREVNPESGKKVIPPIPGNALKKNRPPVTTEEISEEQVDEKVDEQLFEKSPIVLTLDPEPSRKEEEAPVLLSEEKEAEEDISPMKETFVENSGFFGRMKKKFVEKTSVENSEESQTETTLADEAADVVPEENNENPDKDDEE